MTKSVSKTTRPVKSKSFTTSQKLEVIEGKIEVIENKVETIEIKMDDKFRKIDEKFNKVDERLDNLEVDVKWIRQNMATKNDIDRLLGHIDNIVMMFEDRHVDQVAQQLRSDRHEETLDNHESRLKILEHHQH